MRLVDEVGRAFQEHVGAVVVHHDADSRLESAAISQPSSPSSRSPLGDRWARVASPTGPGGAARATWHSSLDSGGRPVCSVESSPAAAWPPPGRRVSLGGTAAGSDGSARWGEQEVIAVGALWGAGSDGSARWGEQEVTGQRAGASLRRRPLAQRGRPMPSPISLQLLDRLRGTVLGAGHPGDGLLHQACRRGRWRRRGASRGCPRRRASPRRSGCCRSGRAAGSGPSRAPRGCRAGWARPGDAGEVDRRVGVHERQRHELGEAAGLVLDPAASTRRCATQCRGLSTWPYIIVELDRMPTRCAVVTTSTQVAVGSLPLVRTQRTSSSRISAAVPGMVSRPASRALISQSSIDRPGAGAPLTISIGENACTCMPGTRCFTAADEVEVRRAGQLGVDAALHADLGARRAPRPPRPGRRPGPATASRRRRRCALGERAEPAADVADVGEVDVAVDHVGDVVADGVAAQVVGEPARPRPSAAPSAVISASACSSGQPRRVRLGGQAQRRPPLVVPGGSRRRRRASAAGRPRATSSQSP